jgi:hypothetical protein
MPAFHIIDIEKTDTTPKMIEALELILCAKYEGATIITDGDGSMYSIYASAPQKPASNAEMQAFTEGVLMAMDFEGYLPLASKHARKIDKLKKALALATDLLK